MKTWDADPLVCPKCSGNMRIVGFIDDEPVIKKVLKHLKVWEVSPHGRPPPAQWIEDDLPCDDDASSPFYDDEFQKAS